MVKKSTYLDKIYNEIDKKLYHTRYYGRLDRTYQDAKDNKTYRIVIALITIIIIYSAAAYALISTGVSNPKLVTDTNIPGWIFITIFAVTPVAILLSAITTHLMDWTEQDQKISNIIDAYGRGANEVYKIVQNELDPSHDEYGIDPDFDDFL